MTDEEARRGRIDEALAILRAVGMPAEQQNERSALTLLGLLDIRPGTPWVEARRPLRGITPLMTFFREVYGKEYAPNTRETVRRFTIHQFVQAGLVIENPDEPGRPVNSPRWCYQVSAGAYALLVTYGTASWEAALARFHAEVGELRARYAREREMTRIPVTLPTGSVVTLTVGGQNDLLRRIVEEFCPRFTPGASVLYLGDAGGKWAVWDREAFSALGLALDTHGKMPDAVVYQPDKGWLVLVEAVTSHGPMSPKRVDELRALFSPATAGLVFVTAFEDAPSLARYLTSISWETEVWIADAPTHLVHFDGLRYLGPYVDR